MTIEFDAPDEALSNASATTASFLMVVSWGGYESLQWPGCALKGLSATTDLPFSMVLVWGLKIRSYLSGPPGALTRM